MRAGAVILGPGTRLARALRESGSLQGYDLLPVARNERERASLESGWPAAIVVPSWEPEWEWPAGYDEVVVCACAVGPIHPEGTDWPGDLETALRDIGVIERILEAYPGASVHLVFVSSALALAAPRAERAYYCGWKVTMEGILAHLAGRHPSARLSVVYPGRLADRRSLSRPASLLGTTYDRLARLMGRIGRAGRSRRALLGLDARLWLLGKGLAACLRALLRA